MSPPVSYILADSGAFTLVAVLTEALRRLALRCRLVDGPGKGKAHAVPTPYLGGVAIASGSLTAAAIAGPPSDTRVLALIAGGIMMAILGLADDIWRLGVLPRLAAECMVASVVIIFGVRADVFGDVLHLGIWPDNVVALLWMVVITNSFNLLDNSDGAATGIAMMTAAALTVLAFAVGSASMELIELAVSAGCAGFLVHNWAPARIFMGDSGSLFLGFTISASALLIVGSPGLPSAGSPISRMCALLLLAFVAIVDTSTVLLSRYRSGLPLLTGGTDHLAHRLRALGLGRSQSALLLSAAATLSCSAAILVIFKVLPAIGTLATTLAAAIALMALAQRVRVYHRISSVTPTAARIGLEAWTEAAASFVKSESGGLGDRPPARTTP